MDKTAVVKISSRISKAFKTCLGLNNKLPKEVMYGWLQELTPLERADLAILRIMRKLMEANLKCKNHELFIKELSTIREDQKRDYIDKKVSMKDLKRKMIVYKNKQLGTGVRVRR